MPLSFRYEVLLGLIVETGSGNISSQEILESHQLRQNLPHDWRVLADYRSANLIATIEDLRLLAANLEIQAAVHVTAWAIVSQDSGSIEKFEKLGAYLEWSLIRLRVFQSLDEAVVWLNGFRAHSSENSMS